MRRTLAEAARAMGGRVVRGDGAASFDGASFDSREIEGGELFFALPGEQSDGHRWVSAALAAGAAAAVIHQEVELADGVPAEAALIRVDDSYEALHALTRHLRDAGMPSRLIAITGSAGKTTTKELLAAILGQRLRVAKNEGNLNNLYGYPLSVLRIADDTEWMVAEMGMSTPGELSQLSRLGRPEVVVYTCVRPVHLEFFGSLRAIADAKAELLEGVAPGGRVVANADDPEVRRFVSEWAARQGDADRKEGASRVIWYGRDRDGEAPALHVAARDIEALGDGQPGSRFTMRVRDLGEERSFEVRLGLHGDYNVDNALAAAACALALGLGPEDVVAGLAAAQPAAGRGIVHDLAGGGALVDDTYNSNPNALDRALASAASLASNRSPARPPWAVLGDMLELGPEAPRFHREAGRRAAELGFDPVAGVGELSREIVAAAGEAGAEAPWFADAAAAADWSSRRLADGDVVLVKGSRGIGLDVVVEALRQVVAKDGAAKDAAANPGTAAHAASEGAA